jgi:hypothetical protein
LQDQCHKLGVIASRFEKLDEMSPALESIGKSLAAIEAQLRNILQSRNAPSQSDPPVERKQRSG